MIKGMPTLIEFNNIEENVDFAKKNNLDFIELNMNLPYCFNLEQNDLLKYNHRFTMHISEELDIGELNDNLREKYLKEILRQLNIGISNNIKKYTIHLNQGIYFTLPNGKYYLDNKYENLYLDNVEKSLNVLNNISMDNNIQINFENTKITPFIEKAIKLIARYSNLGFTLDIGHNEKNSNYAWIKFDRKKINHIHLHDYDGQKDHLALGFGIIDFSKYKEILNSKYVVIEVKQSKELLESLKYLKHYENN